MEEILILHSATAHLIQQNQCEETHDLRELKIKKKSNEYNFLSSYFISNIGFYDEEIINSVKVIFEDDKITLQGTNLKCIHCN